MKHTRIHGVLLAAAFLHLFADVAFAGGAMLCIGPNDHRAIEVGHLTQNCESLQETWTTQNSGLAGGACTDSPLHTEPEMSSKRTSWDAPASTSLVSLVGGSVPPTVDIWHPIRQSSGLSKTIRAHRSIVLII